MNPDEIFDRRIAEIHGTSKGDDQMDVRHEEFMAMAHAFLGPHFDRDKLAEVEALQLEFHSIQAKLYAELRSNRIARPTFVDECNRANGEIARQCELILGPPNFHKLFGATATELAEFIDKDTFLFQI